MVSGSCAYGLHVLESRRVLQQLRVDRGDVVEPKKLQRCPAALF
jgi:hypothetical protein